MRKLTKVGKLTFNLGSIFLFAAALLALALYMDDQTASWFNGVPTSILWPIDIVLAALGFLGIMFMLRWGRVGQPIDEEVLHFTTLIDTHEIKPITEAHEIAAPEEMEHPVLEFESEAIENAENHEEEFESDEP
jgi:hypothetical protein